MIVAHANGFFHKGYFIPREISWGLDPHDLKSFLSDISEIEFEEIDHEMNRQQNHALLYDYWDYFIQDDVTEDEVIGELEPDTMETQYSIAVILQELIQDVVSTGTLWVQDAYQKMIFDNLLTCPIYILNENINEFSLRVCILNERISNFSFIDKSKFIYYSGEKHHKIEGQVYCAKNIVVECLMQIEYLEFLSFFQSF